MVIENEVDIVSMRRDGIELCSKLIPLMELDELEMLFLALTSLISRLESEGRVVYD